MKYGVLAFLAAFKVVLVLVWVLAGWDFKASQVHAETPARSSNAAAEPAGKTPEAGDVKAEPGRPDERDRALLASIARRQKELDAREEEIKAGEERLKALKADVESRIAELNKANGKIEAFYRKLDEINDERTRKVVKIYESMSPEEAAPRIEKLEPEAAASIIAAMSEKKAAKILGLIDVGRSVKLSESLKLKTAPKPIQ